MGWAATARAATLPAVLPPSPGAQARAGGTPKPPPWSAPALRLLQAAPGAELGLGWEVMGVRHVWCQMPERWESSEVKKQEENPNQAMGM